jgi:hypothetical protein
MSGELEKRASDAEREQVVLRLRDASADDVPPNPPRVRVRSVSLFGPVFVQARRS